MTERRWWAWAVATIALGTMLFAGATTLPAQPRADAFGRYHALVIGNERYRALTVLKTPAADARAVADVLKRDYAFASVRLLVDATRTQMVTALDDLRRRLGPDDNLLVYYAGHGVLDAEADRGYWLPVDAERDNRANWLSNADVTDALKAMRAKHVLIVADSCYAGTLTRDVGIRATDGADLARLAQRRARSVLASGGLEPVLDRGGSGHSVFARAFLGALRGNSGVTDMATLFAGLRRTVMLGAEQTPQYADIRIAGHEGGDFIFVRPGARLAALPAPTRPAPVPSITTEIVREYGSVGIRSRLAGVELWLGGEKIGETQAGAMLVVNNVVAGTHRLRAKKAGQKDWERDIEVAANQRAEVLIDIEPLRPPPPAPRRSEDAAEMVLVPAGEFWMGSDDGPVDEKPRRRVNLDAYAIDKSEVTNALYKRFMDATRRAAPESWTDARWNGAMQPVVGVSWHDADAYCRWAGKRLPTEAEWEKGARGTDGAKYPWGDLWDASRTNSWEGNRGTTVPVGSYPGGVSPYGAHDMAGNVWEWVADWYEQNYYTQSPESNPQGPRYGVSRVIRGGSWSFAASFLRTASRHIAEPNHRRVDIGFRCARGAS